MGRARERASKRASDDLDDPRGREPTAQERGALLRQCHDGFRLWRICKKKDCKRARCCRGDIDECARHFPAVTAWLQETLKGERAGLSPASAARAAAERIWPARNAAPRAPQQRAAAR
jgi:hypothetical protein